MKPQRIRLFIKPYCGWCRQAVRWLNQQGFPYETLDVIGNSNAYDEMIRLSGQTYAPVIEVDGQVLADFDTDELDAFWTKLELPRR